MTIVFNMGFDTCDDAILQMLLDEIDNIDNFEKVYITED
jgi:hypothetical protein